MKIHYSHIDTTHFVDFFSEKQYNAMYEELMMLCVDGIMLDAKEAGGATSTTGEMLRNNKGIPIESIMPSSSIIEIFSERIGYPYSEYMSFSHLINYYSNGHYYGYHKDKSDYTAITVFHKEPKEYSGGDLTFKDNYGTIIPDLKPRDLIVFPGSLDHSVTPMVGGNRISVSRFMKERLCR